MALDPYTHNIFDKKIDRRLRDCIAHGTYTINITNGLVTFHDFVTSESFTHSPEEINRKFSDLFCLLISLITIFFTYYIPIFEKKVNETLTNGDIERLNNNLDTFAPFLELMIYFSEKTIKKS